MLKNIPDTCTKIQMNDNRSVASLFSPDRLPEMVLRFSETTAIYNWVRNMTDKGKWETTDHRTWRKVR